MAWQIGGILFAIALGVAANLLTPYIKGIFQRGFVGLRKFKAEILEARISDAHLYNRNPAWLAAYLISEVIYFLIVSAVALYIITVLFQYGYKERIFLIIPLAVGHTFTTLSLAFVTYRRALRPTHYEAKARKKIAKLTGKKHDELESGDAPPRP